MEMTVAVSAFPGNACRLSESTQFRSDRPDAHIFRRILVERCLREVSAMFRATRTADRQTCPLAALVTAPNMGSSKFVDGMLSIVLASAVANMGA